MDGAEKNRDQAERGNRYCARLGIRVPRLAEFARRDDPRLFPLVVVALLENGRPMLLDELVDRIALVKKRDTEGLGLSISKAWHGLPPVRRDGQGRYSIDVHCEEIRFFLLEHNLLREQSQLAKPRVVTFSPPAEKRDDEPLTTDEVGAALRERCLSNVSALRRSVAILDSMRRPLSFAEINKELGQLNRSGPISRPAFDQFYRYDELRQRDDGRFEVAPASPKLFAHRRAIRKLAANRLNDEARHRHYQRLHLSERELEEVRERRLEAEALMKRRFVIQTWPPVGVPQAVVVINVNEQTIESFGPSQLELVGPILQSSEVIAGLDLLDAVDAFRIDPIQTRIVNLAPSQRSIQRDGSKVVRVTPERIVRSSLGLVTRFTTPKQLDRLALADDWSGLLGRLEAEAKALFALYRFGVLHREVRVAHGGIDAMLHVDWAEPGDPDLYQLLLAAHRVETEVDIVVGLAPEWGRPWDLALRVTIETIERDLVTVSHEDETLIIERDDIQAIRIPSRHESLR